MTTRTVRDSVANALDYLVDSELAIFANPISVSDERISWHALNRSQPFLLTHDHLTVDQFLDWVIAGHYSCILLDGSLLQITYDLRGGDVCGHRLAYVPCPVTFDPALLNEEPLGDLVEVIFGSDPSSVALRTPIRFDFDPDSASTDGSHPAAHLTLNSVHCRIACIAPVHVGRFLDFVFRNFYPDLRAAHAGFFDPGSRLHVGEHMRIADRHVPHLSWAQAKENLGETDYRAS